jgi:hypothetical protein
MQLIITAWWNKTLDHISGLTTENAQRKIKVHLEGRGKVREMEGWGGGTLREEGAGPREVLLPHTRSHAQGLFLPHVL